MSRIDGQVWKCDRAGCGHVWYTGSEEAPKSCARCKSRKWNLVVDAVVEKKKKSAEATPGGRGAAIGVQKVVGGSTGCQRCGDGLVPWGTSMRCMKCGINYSGMEQAGVPGAAPPEGRTVLGEVREVKKRGRPRKKIGETVPDGLPASVTALRPTDQEDGYIVSVGGLVTDVEALEAKNAAGKDRVGVDAGGVLPGVREVSHGGSGDDGDANSQKNGTGVAGGEHGVVEGAGGHAEGEVGDEQQVDAGGVREVRADEAGMPAGRVEPGDPGRSEVAGKRGTVRTGVQASGVAETAAGESDEAVGEEPLPDWLEHEGEDEPFLYGRPTSEVPPGTDVVISRQAPPPPAEGRTVPGEKPAVRLGVNGPPVSLAELRLAVEKINGKPAEVPVGQFGALGIGAGAEHAAEGFPLCPKIGFNETDGERYRCRLEKGHKGKCAPGERVDP